MPLAVKYVPAQLEQVARELGLRMVVLFGSRATGRALRPTSDLDIAVLDRVVPTWTRWVEVHRALSQVFRPYELDLAFLNTADAFFRLEIMRRGVLLYGDRVSDSNAYPRFAQGRAQNMIWGPRLLRLRRTRGLRPEPGLSGAGSRGRRSRHPAPPRWGRTDTLVGFEVGVRGVVDGG